METLKAYQSYTNQNPKNSGNGNYGNGSENYHMSNSSTALLNDPSKSQQSSGQKKTINVGQNSRFLFDVDEDDDEEDDDYVEESHAQRHQAAHSRMNGMSGSSASCHKRAKRQQQARSNQHMTRNRTANDPSLTRTSSSIFNIPTLSRVHVLLQTIDAARKERDRVFHEYIVEKKQRLLAQGSDTIDDTADILSAGQMTTGPSSGGSTGSRGYLASISAEGMWKIKYMCCSLALDLIYYDLDI